MVYQSDGTLMVEMTWWNSHGPTLFHGKKGHGEKVMVKQSWLNSNSGTVMMKKSWWNAHGGTVIVEKS